MTTLARMELRRLRPVLLRTGLLTAVGAPLLLALGGQPALSYGLVVVGISVWMQGPMELLRDRIKGDLLLLSTLPVPPATVAAGKFVAIAVTSVLSALLFAGAGALGLPDVVPSVSLPAAAVGTFLWSWIFVTATSFVAAALLARFRLRTLTGGAVPLVLVVGFLGLIRLLERLLPDPWARLEWLLARPWLPLAATLVSVALAGFVSWGAFRLTSTGIRDYRPEPDAVSW